MYVYVCACMCVCVCVCINDITNAMSSFFDQQLSSTSTSHHIYRLHDMHACATMTIISEQTARINNTRRVHDIVPGIVANVCASYGHHRHIQYHAAQVINLACVFLRFFADDRFCRLNKTAFYLSYFGRFDAILKHFGHLLYNVSTFSRSFHLCVCCKIEIHFTSVSLSIF